MQYDARTETHRRWRRLVCAAVASLLLPLVAASQEAEPAVEASEAAPAELDGPAIARRAEDVVRSDRTYMEATMTVVSPRLRKPREVAFRSWDDRGRDRSFIRILSPAKDAGTGFLRLPPNLWTYVPRVERTMRIPPSMMLQPWMGSDFTNDDLVNESSAIEDYEHRLLRIDESPEGHGGLRAYVVEYKPREEAAVVWGKIVAWIATEHFTPLRQDFYDEDGAKVRSMRFGDIREVKGRHYPHHWSMTPLEKEGHETRLQVDRVDFDASFDDGVFTTRNLKKR
jgi:outer membrane lipoprotein-sorting protein